MKEFIDEFKRLEKICNEIYSEQHGVTLYINEMEEKSGYDSRKISDWDRDLTKLKRVRHIRNNLVHDVDETLEYDISDIEFIKEFYQKIITGQDPLALLQKQLEETIPPKTHDIFKPNTIYVQPIVTEEINNGEEVDDVKEDENEEEGSIIQTIILGVILAALILFGLYMIFYRGLI